MEKHDPEQTANNLVAIYSHILQMGVSCFLLSLCPVLATEARHASYSSCWSSIVNYHLAGLCHQKNIPYLPIDSLLFQQVQGGTSVGAAPTRQLVASKGVLGSEGKHKIGMEIIRYNYE